MVMPFSEADGGQGPGGRRGAPGHRGPGGDNLREPRRPVIAGERIRIMDPEPWIGTLPIEITLPEPETQTIPE